MTKEKKIEWRYIGDTKGLITLADGTHEVKHGTVVTTAQDLTEHPNFEPVKPLKPTKEESGN